jgi:hypothetical protein
MQKAFEYEAEFDKSGRLLRRRWSIGPVLITSMAGLVLALTGHSLRSGISAFVKTVKWW